MKNIPILFCSKLAVMAFAIGAAVTPAQAAINVQIDIAPPAPRYERIPVVPSGYVWAPGYWAYENNDYRWVRGRQIAQRPGQRWVPDRWEEGNRYRAGYWEPDHGGKHNGKHKDKNNKNRGNGNGNGDFCPPGQAKKGNC